MAGEPALDMSEIIDLYKDDARRMVGEMRQALEHWPDVVSKGASFQQLRRLSHQLRGSGRTYGFRSVTLICKALEKTVQKMEKCQVVADDRTRHWMSVQVDRLAAIFTK
jgi:chemotaxis protein histidine kinase CheA